MSLILYLEVSAFSPVFFFNVHLGHIIRNPIVKVFLGSFMKHKEF